MGERHQIRFASDRVIHIIVQVNWNCLKLLDCLNKKREQSEMVKKLRFD